MREIMSKYGFNPAGTCNCGGIYTEKFRRGADLVRIRPRRYKFTIYHNGGVVLNWTDLKDLENKMNEIFPIPAKEAISA